MKDTGVPSRVADLEAAERVPNGPAEMAATLRREIEATRRQMGEWTVGRVVSNVYWYAPELFLVLVAAVLPIMLTRAYGWWPTLLVGLVVVIVTAARVCRDVWQRVANNRDELSRTERRAELLEAEAARARGAGEGDELAGEDGGA